MQALSNHQVLLLENVDTASLEMAVLTRPPPEGWLDIPDFEVTTMEQKKWYESKINWTAVVGAAAQLVNVFGLVVPPEMIPQVAVGMALAQSVVTMVLRNYFTK